MRRVILSLFLLVVSSVSAATDTVTVKKGDTLYRIAKAHGLSAEQLRALNGLKDNTIEVGQVLRIAGKLPQKAAGAAATPSKPVSSTVYTVKTGDTVYRIAAQHGLSVAKLRAINNLKDNTITEGQVLRLKGNVASTTSTPKTSSKVTMAKAQAKPNQAKPNQAKPNQTKPSQAKPVSPKPVQAQSAAPKLNQAKPNNIKLPTAHTVKAGDTLGKLAERYSVSVGALQAANGLAGTVILVGQRLRIPPKGAKTPSAPRIPPGMEARTIYTYERVALKDTPALFAQRYNTTPDALRRLNGLGTVRQICYGAKLLVPRRMAVPIPPRVTRSAATYRQMTVQNIPLQVVQVDLRHRDVLVAPVLPSRGLNFGSGATVGALTQRSGAQALVNGSYFHPQTYAPAGDIVMQGRLLTWGRLPAALAITPDNRASITGNTTALFGRPLDSSWAGMETVVASGPRIVYRGAVQTSYSNVFQDPAVFGRAARSAVGLSSNRDLVFVSTHAKLTTVEMGRVMVALGVHDALLLDGGSSAGISFNGSILLNSIRKVSYGIGVFTGYTGRRYAR